MGKFTEASGNIKRLSSMFKGLMDLSDEMDKVDSLENHVAELENLKVKLLVENEDLKKDIHESTEAISSNSALANTILSDAKKLGAKMIEDAQAKVDQTMVDAEVAGQEKLKEMTETEEKFMTGFEKAQAELETINSTIETQSIKLAEINAQLEKIKGGI